MNVVITVDESRAKFFQEMEEELIRISNRGFKLKSCHEGYALMLEEVDEVWDIVKMKAKNRDYKHLRTELVQVATMALRHTTDLEEFKK